MGKLHHEVLRRLWRLSPAFADGFQKGTRYALMVVAFVLTISVAVIGGVVYLVTSIAPYLRRGTRIARVAAIQAYKKACTVAHSLRNKERQITPQVLGAISKFEKSAIQAAPQVKKAAWSFGRFIFLAWMVLSLAAALALLVLAPG